jgi:PAS domain S-box-containing protein
MKTTNFSDIARIASVKPSDIHSTKASAMPDLGNLQLGDVMNVEAIQRIQDAFSKANDVASIILDMDRRPVTVPSNFNEVCRLIKQSPKGRGRCDLSDKARNEKSKQFSGPVYHQCLSCGFVDGSAPIFIGKLQVAEWLIGQVNVMGVSKERIIEYATEIGADVDAMVNAFERMPRIGLDKFEHTLDLLFVIAGEISRLGYNTWQMAREIKMRTEAETELQRSELRYQELFNSVVEGICIVDENHVIRFANPALARMFDVKSVDSILNRNTSEFFDKDQQDVIAIQNIKRKQGQSSQYEVKIKNHKGDYYDVLISASPRFDENGAFRGTIASLVDISELKRLQEFASRAQRLEAAGRIAAQVAHDFNNLLGPLVAYPEIIKAEIPDASSMAPLLDDMEKAATMMADINQQLLTLGRRGHFTMEILGLNELIQRAIGSYYNRYQSLEIDLNLCRDLLCVEGGSSQIVRVLTNIINNAIDAMGKSGKLTIKTDNYYVDILPRKKYSIPTGEYVKVTISDTGCGIPPEVLPFVYDPFYTTKTTDHKRGSGLGLSVVHAVMKDHNGFVDIESRPGKGTAVHLYFPISRSKPKNQQASLNDLQGGQEKILIVDDDKMQCEVMLNLVNRLGYIATVAESGEEALNKLKIDSYDLLLLDMILPGVLDGTDIYEKSLMLNPRQKAIIVSGYADKNRVHKAGKLGLTTIIKKPVTLKSLAQAIHLELNRKLVTA